MTNNDKYSVAGIVSSAWDSNPIAVRDAFNALTLDRISDKVDVIRNSLSRTMWNSCQEYVPTVSNNSDDDTEINPEDIDWDSFSDEELDEIIGDDIGDDDDQQDYSGDDDGETS